MSNVDVGDAVELTFESAPGADVTVSWLDPSLAPVLDQVPVPEVPAGTGKFPKTFLPTVPGMWQAVFTASGNATAVETFYLRAVSITGPPPLATVGEVASQYGTMTPAQEGLTSTLLRVASKLIRQRFPNVDAMIASGKLDPEVVALAVTNMVLRVLRNPSGLKAETIGPFSRTYDVTVAAGLIVLTGSEEVLLAPPVKKTGRASTIWVRPGLLGGQRGY